MTDTGRVHADAEETMIVNAARMLSNHQSCFVGIGLPSVAANLARESHAPDLFLIYESGCLGSKPTTLPLSIGDGDLALTSTAVVGVPEIFNYWLQAGRIDVGFLGVAQIDRFANINTTVIGPYDDPAVRLPGAGGAPEIAASCGEVIVIVRHSPRTFVDCVDFITSVGHGDGLGSREANGLIGRGPSAVVTDLGILRPDPESRELVLTGVHPGVTVDQVVEATGWDLEVSEQVAPTEPPSARELHQLRDLRGRNV